MDDVLAQKLFPGQALPEVTRARYMVPQKKQKKVHRSISTAHFFCSLFQQPSLIMFVLFGSGLACKQWRRRTT